MKRMKRGWASLTLFVSMLGLVVIAPPSQAGSGTCTYDSVSQTVTVTAIGEGPFYIRLRRQGAEIWFKNPYDPPYEYESCGGATVYNTDLIEFHDETEAARGNLVIEQERGSFAPGATPEPRGLSEIEFDIATGSGYGVLGIVGTPQSDRVVGGDRGLKLNRDADLDVRVSGPGLTYLVYGDAGDDFVFLDGREGTGSAGAVAVTHRMGGGPGDDYLVGDSKHDGFTGGGGDDSMYGSGGEDFFYTGAGADRIFGGPGSDEILTHNGPDYVEAGSGDDFIKGWDGDDRLKGGPGKDRILGYLGRYGWNTPEDDDADKIWGQAGDDKLLGDGGNDHVIGGSGSDVVKGLNGSDNLEGSSGDDRILGHKGNDHLDGDAGRDRCASGPGKDTKEDCER